MLGGYFFVGSVFFGRVDIEPKVGLQVSFQGKFFLKKCCYSFLFFFFVECGLVGLFLNE